MMEGDFYQESEIGKISKNQLIDTIYYIYSKKIKSTWPSQQMHNKNLAQIQHPFKITALDKAEQKETALPEKRHV